MYVCYARTYTLGLEEAMEISSHLKTGYTVTRFTPDKDEWSPEQPKEYTTLALIHHKNRPTQNQIIRLAKEKGVGNVDKIIAAAGNQLLAMDVEASLRKCLQASEATCDISDVLAPLEETDNTRSSQIVLIEGAPGLGKTVLLKQIAFEWAQGKMLVNSLLVFLVTLRDPAVWKMSSVFDLLQYCCRHLSETSKACVDYNFKAGGKNVTILLDGYDELQNELREDGFIADIVNHRVLPLSAVVVTSRPHASAHLRSYATSHAEILGFSKEDQHRYFGRSLESEPDKLHELIKYLNDHPTIKSLCFVPFNMTVLLWLFKQGVPLSSSSTELYNCFICHTVHHHLIKAKVTLDNITDLNDLPQPYQEIIQQLSILCLQALHRNQLVFTLQEIKAACPKIESIPGAINAFGLLQAVEHYSVDSRLMGTPTKTLNFIHSSVREFIAAYQISRLPYRKGLRFIKNNFFSDFHFNAFAMYVGITKGQSASFKRFLSTYGKSIFSFFPFNSNKIAKKFLKDERTCLRLFQCFHEADDTESCRNVTETFHARRKIEFCEHVYDAFPFSEIQCLGLFLSTSPTKHWKALNLWSCNIGDAGIRLLHQSLVTSDILIDHMDLSNNSLTSRSAQEIADIVIQCKVAVLNLTSNSLGDSRLLEFMFTKYSTIEKLSFGYNNLNSVAAIGLFSSLNKNKNTKLKELDLHCNSFINDDVVTEIATFLKGNNSLTYLNLLAGNVNGASVQCIIESLMDNMTLSCLYLSTSTSGHDFLHKISTKIRLRNENRSQYGFAPLEIHCYPGKHRCQLYELDV